MPTITDADLQAALDRCAQEPVHTIGQIQPHGLLFALSEPDLIVRQVSANVATLLDIPPQKILGQSFQAVLGPDQFQLFQAKSLYEDSPFPSPTRLLLGDPALEFDCLSHRHDGVLIVELELIRGAYSLAPFNLNGHFRLPLARLEKASNILELSQVTAAEIRRLSGFDRVMVYRFDPEWNGEVVAESTGQSTSFLGLHFPASDIPTQARRLFLLNRLRTIVNIGPAPVPIVPEIGPLTGRPLDLTFSLLRSPASVHVDYLRNMGVQASLTVSIIVRGQLWGLIACHHYSPRHVDYLTRSLCEVVGQNLGSQLTLQTQIDQSALQFRLASRNLLDRYMDEIDASQSLVRAESLCSGLLLELFAADGLLIEIEGAISYQGHTGDAAALLPAVQKLRESASRGIAASHCLSELHPAAAGHLSGALYIGLAEETGDYMLLLRRELVETVAWAGNPDKSLTTDALGRLSPRGSFDTWKETVRGQSRRWSEFELENAGLLREKLLRRAGALATALSGRRYRFLADTMPQLIWCAKPNGQGEYYNQRWTTYTGLSLQQALEEGWAATIHPDDLATYVDRWTKTIGTEHDFELEVRIKRAYDGAYRWHLARAFPLRSEGGEVIQWVGCATDIEDQKRARQQLQLAVAERTVELSLAKEQLQTVLDGATNVAIIATDTHGVITLFNSGAENMLGYSAGELVGKETPQIIHLASEVVARGLELSAQTGRAVEGFEIFVDSALQGGHEEREWTYVRKDGSHLTVHLVVTALRDALGTVSGFLCVAMDVTARKIAEERFQLVVEAAPSAMLMVGNDARISLVNSQTEKLFGYSRQELLGQSIVRLVPQKFRSRHDAHLAAFFASPSTRPMGAGRELFARRKDGGEIPVEIGLTPIKTSQGEFVLASIMDITERKSAEQDLLDARNSLELRLAELAQANNELAKKNEEVEAFVYIVSHDLRSPLVNLQGFCKELQLSCDELREKRSPSFEDPRTQTILQEEIPAALRYVSASTTKFHRLINALLELSRYGRQEYRPEELDLAGLVQSSLDLLSLSIAAHGIQVCVGPMAAARGDATAVGQVFANLIGNAVKYLQPGRPGRIEVGAEPQGAFVHCWVRDNGAGLPASAKSRLFQVFQRFHPALAEGEGMGLAIVRRVVERHGGRIWAEGEEGVGSTFHFTLPGAGGPAS